MTPRGFSSTASALVLAGLLLAGPLTVTGGSPASAAGPRSGAGDGTPTFGTDPAWGLDRGFAQDGLAYGPAGFGAAVAADTDGDGDSDGDGVWFAASTPATTTTPGTDGPRSILVGRRTASGALDTSLGDGRGWVSFHAPGTRDDDVQSMTLDHQGRVVVLSETPRTIDHGFVVVDQVLVTRFTRDLRPDRTFGDDGVSLVRTHYDMRPTSLALQPDGAIVVGGSDRESMFAVRLHPDGTLDRPFGGGDGTATLSGAPKPSSASAMTITSDAKIVLAGSYADDDDGQTTGEVAQLLPSGQPDPTFGSDGVVALPGPGLGGVVQLPDGTLAVVSADSGTSLVRLSRTGHPVSWPGSRSAVRDLDLSPLTSARIHGLALQHSGRLVLVGDGDDDGYDSKGYLVVQAGGDGRLAADFGEHGHVLVPWRADVADPDADGSAAATSVVVDSRDRIVVGGGVRTVSPPSLGIIRFAATTPPLVPTIDLRQTTADGRWRSCGTSASAPCRVAAGSPVHVGGRTWPAPSTDRLRLQVQGVDGSHGPTVATYTTAEGNFLASFTSGAPEHLRVRARVPATSTTVRTAGQWRYLEVASTVAPQHDP